MCHLRKHGGDPVKVSKKVRKRSVSPFELGEANAYFTNCLALLVLIQDTNGLFEGFNLEGEEISKVLFAQALSPKR